MKRSSWGARDLRQLSLVDQTDAKDVLVLLYPSSFRFILVYNGTLTVLRISCNTASASSLRRIAEE